MKPSLNDALLIEHLRHARARGATRRQLLVMTAELMRAAGPPYTGVYLYMVDGDVLALEAYDGADTEHTRIPLGQGLCGRSVATGADLNVGDVAQEPDYLACSVTTRSELICLLRAHGQVIGQIDIDSDTPHGFPPAEQAAVRRVADVLQEML